MKKFLVKYKTPICIIIAIFICIFIIKLSVGIYFPLNRDNWGMQTYEEWAEIWDNEIYKSKSGGIINWYSNKDNSKLVVVPKYIDGKKVVRIDDYAFDYNCEDIETIIVPEGIKEIEKRAFYGCKNLKTIYLPMSVEDINASSLVFGNNNVNVITFNPKIN